MPTISPRNWICPVFVWKSGSRIAELGRGEKDAIVIVVPVHQVKIKNWINLFHFFGFPGFPQFSVLHVPLSVTFQTDRLNLRPSTPPSAKHSKLSSVNFSWKKIVSKIFLGFLVWKKYQFSYRNSVWSDSLLQNTRGIVTNSAESGQNNDAGGRFGHQNEQG